MIRLRVQVKLYKINELRKSFLRLRVQVKFAWSFHPEIRMSHWAFYTEVSVANNGFYKEISVIHRGFYTEIQVSVWGFCNENQVTEAFTMKRGLGLLIEGFV